MSPMMGKPRKVRTKAALRGGPGQTNPAAALSEGQPPELDDAIDAFHGADMRNQAPAQVNSVRLEAPPLLKAVASSPRFQERGARLANTSSSRKADTTASPAAVSHDHE